MRIATTTWFNKPDYVADNFCNLNYGAPQNARRLGKPKDVGCRLAQYPKARDAKATYGEQALVNGASDTALSSRIVPVPGLIENPLDTMKRHIAKNIIRVKAKRNDKDQIKAMRTKRMSHVQHTKSSKHSDFGTSTMPTRMVRHRSDTRFEHDSDVDLAKTLPNRNLRLAETTSNHDDVFFRPHSHRFDLNISILFDVFMKSVIVLSNHPNITGTKIRRQRARFEHPAIAFSQPSSRPDQPHQRAQSPKQQKSLAWEQACQPRTWRREGGPKNSIWI